MINWDGPLTSGWNEEDNTYTTDAGQVLSNIHHKELCKNENCLVHNPSDHDMRGFPTYWRSDRAMMERICPHGVGHPDPDDISEDRTHGCDGCC